MYTLFIDLQFGYLAITPEVEKRMAELGYTPVELAQEIKAHKEACGKPAVYCGTYAKYNNGSLKVHQ